MEHLHARRQAATFVRNEALASVREEDELYRC